MALLGVAGRCTFSLALLFIFLRTGCCDFKFLKDPATNYVIIVVQLSTNFKVDCSTNDPNATVSLIFRKFPPNPWTVLAPKPGKLYRDGDLFTVVDYKLSDGGFYQCRATNRTGFVLNWANEFWGRIVARQKIAPTVEITPEYVALSVGSNINITCTVGDLYVTMKWQKRSPDVSDTDIPTDRIVTSVNTIRNEKHLILMFKNTQLSDMSTYRCSAVGSSGLIGDKLVYLAVYESKEPVITPQSGMTALVSSTKEIICQIQAFPKLEQVKWSKANKEIKITGCPLNINSLNPCVNEKYTMKITSSGNVLHSTSLKIKKIKYEDHGVYICKATNRKGSSSSEIFLNVEGKPVLDEGQQAFLEVKDVPAKIHCKISVSKPPATFSWEVQPVSSLCTSNCHPVEVLWRKLTKYTVRPAANVPTNVSTVYIPAKSDPAYFRCTATNKIGSSNRTVTYLHLDDPGKDFVNIKYPSTKYARVDELSVLRVVCVVYKQLITTNGVQWLHGREVLSSATDARVKITSTKLNPEFHNYVLTIVNVTLNDSGVYTCDALGLKPQRVINDTVNITVLALQAPNITGMKDQVVKEEEVKHVEFICQVTGHPKPDISWSKLEKNGEWRKLSKLTSIDSCKFTRSGFYFYRGREGSPLVICDPEFDLGHSGKYKCEATNSQGKELETATLDVLEGAHIKSPKSKSVSIAVGSRINETCHADGNPTPQVQWTTSEGSEVTVLKNGYNEVYLEVGSVKEGVVNYTCTAFNYKSDSVVLTVTGAIPPNPSPALSKQALAGIISGCIVFLLVVLCIYLITYFRHRKEIKEYREIYFQRTGQSDYKLDPDRSLLEQVSDLPYDHDFEFPEDMLILGKILGQGAFGQVLQAQAIGMVTFKPRDKSPEAVKMRSRLRKSMRKSKKGNDYNSMRATKTIVAIKCLKEGASQSDYKDLASELKILIHVGEHKNIVNVLGACTRGRRLMVIIEFAPHGNLLNFLRERREVFEPTWTKTTNDPEREYTLVDISMAAYQISKGAEFLASKKCVHRDLAARNILVGPDYTMKVSDFGLARDIYQDDLYVKNTSGLLPVKWMALESLFDRVYTEKTDVWSFGILLWEIFTLGGTPYPGLPTEQLLDYLSEGQRMAQPQNCPLEVYTIMRDCWMQYPDQRPSFLTVAERLGKVLERNVAKENPYIQIIADENSGTPDYYLRPNENKPSKRLTVDGYEEPLPTPSGESSSRYDSPLPSLPPNISDEDIANSPLPSIPPSYDQAVDRAKGKNRASESSAESGIDVDEKNRRAEREKLLEEVPPDHEYYNDVDGRGKGQGKGKKRLVSYV